MRWTCLSVMFLLSVGTARGDALPNPTPAQMREDLTYLRDVWKPQEKSFNAAQTRQFDTLMADSVDHTDRLDSVSFWMLVSRAVALAHNGHTNVNAGDPPYPGLPFEAWWFKDGLYIVEAAPGHEELLGARVDRIGPKSAEEALQAVAPFICGNKDRVRNFSQMYLRIPALLHHLGMGPSDTETQLTVQLRSGATKKVNLQAGDSPAGNSDNFDVLIPMPADQQGRWPHVLDSLAERPAAYQKHTDLETRWLGDGHEVLYLRSNQVEALDEKGPTLEMKLLLAANDVLPKQIRAVIVDLRLNGGGNFLNTILFSQVLPYLLAADGKALVLVSSSTFSAAIVEAALIRETTGPRCVFIGTAMGDNDRFYAEGKRLPLPNSKLGVRLSPGLHDWSAGCPDLQQCFWATTVWGPKTAISLQPDYPINPTFADYAAGRDPVLDKALELATARAQTPNPAE